jgi:hypothetical protein
MKFVKILTSESLKLYIFIYIKKREDILKILIKFNEKFSREYEIKTNISNLIITMRRSINITLLY